MEMPQLRKSGIGGLRQLFLDGFPQAVWKRPSAFPHSHRPDGGFTQLEIGEFRRCGFLLKTVSGLTEAIHFGNDIHPSVATVSHTGCFASEQWMPSDRNHWWDCPEYAPRLASISSERQVSSHAQIDVARIIAARLPFSVGKRRKSTEDLDCKLLKLFRRRVWRETLNQ
jgi:hypothetical protein